MDPYAKPNEKKTGRNRPKIVHTGGAEDLRTQQQRKAEKEAVAAERRSIKKAARRHLKQQLSKELDEGE
jgi:hypothetical protein